MLTHWSYVFLALTHRYVLSEVAYTLQPLGGVLSSARSPLLQLTTKSHPASAMTVFRDVCRVRFYGTQSASLDFLDLSPAGTSGGEDTYCIYVGSHMVTCAERASLPSTVNIDPGSDLEVLLWFWASNYTEAQARFWLRLTGEYIGIFSCDQAALWMVFSVRLSVYSSVHLSVCPSVLSVCHTFLTMFPSLYHHENFRSYHQGPG